MKKLSYTLEKINVMNLNEFEIRKYAGKNYVLRKVSRPSTVPAANFANSGKAMAGFLRPNESLKHFIFRTYKVII